MKRQRQSDILSAIEYNWPSAAFLKHRLNYQHYEFREIFKVKSKIIEIFENSFKDTKNFMEPLHG